MFRLLPIVLLCAGCSVLDPTHGIPNLHQIDAGVYRGAQPTPAGWRWLAKQGVVFDIKLNTDSEATDADATAAGLRVYKCPITFMQQINPLQHDSTYTQVAVAVGFMSNGRCFVHCGSEKRTASWTDKQLKIQGGQDRTGLVSAAYRVWKDKWTRDAARNEMLIFGYHPALLGLEWVWNHDIEEVGLR